MVDKETATKEFMRQKEVFADAFNYYVHNGEQNIDPNNLKEREFITNIQYPHYFERLMIYPVEPLDSAIVMTDNKFIYLLMIAVGQPSTECVMSLKNLTAYLTASQLQNAGDDYSVNLKPVLPLMIYFGSDKWNGPMSFHEMLNTQDKRVLSKVQDFKVNLIAPADIADDDFGKFKSTLKEVLKYIKYSQNDDKVQEFVNNSEVLEKLGNKEIRVLNACADANLEEMEEKEEFNPDEMCEAIKTIADRAAKEAAKKVTEEAEEQLRLDTLFKNINKMMSKMEYTKEQAMDLLDVSESDQKMLLERFK